jgi:hypothetical protein
MNRIALRQFKRRTPWRGTKHANLLWTTHYNYRLDEIFNSDKKYYTLW